MHQNNILNRLTNKKILFFSANFFGYDKEIKNALITAGAYVDMFDDRPSNSTLAKSLIRLEPLFLSTFTHRYFKKIIKSNKTDYDFVFFITCEAALKKDLQLLKKSYPSAKFILYLYDSLTNLKHFEEKKDFFDKIYTFDLQDKEKYNINFLPLFYLDAYKRKDNNVNEKYDVSFIGTSHSDRPYIINMIKKQLDNMQMNYYFKLYTPSKILHFLKLFLNKDYRILNSKGIITLEKTTASSIAEIMNDSKAVVDIQHPKQTGLTMRSIELVGMRKKNITTNSTVANYDFYDSNNIEIINRSNININIKFFEKEYKQINKDIYEKYALENWILQLFQYEEKI